MGDRSDGVGFRISSKRLPTGWTQRANRLLDRLFGFAAFNAAFDRAAQCRDSELGQAILDALGVRVELSGAPKETIPREGALVVISNHPFGVLDAVAVHALLSSVRPDVSLLAAHWFAQIPRLQRPFMIIVGAQGAKKRRRQSVAGWRMTLQRLDRGEAILVFPAGQAARFDWGGMRIADLPWSAHVASVVRRASAAVVPVFFAGGNSRTFYVLTAIFPGAGEFPAGARMHEESERCRSPYDRPLHRARRIGEIRQRRRCGPVSAWKDRGAVAIARAAHFMKSLRRRWRWWALEGLNL